MAFDFPNSPTVGQTFSPSGGPTYTWNGTAWLLPAQSGGASVTISDAAPSSPSNGALWWESNTGQFWISYNDANSVQWVQLNGVSAAAQAGVLNVQVFTNSGTYTPTAGMQTAVVECVGGGAGGQGMTGTASQYNIGGGGGAGAYARKFVTSAQVGASQVVTIGLGGIGAAAAVGGAGGDTSVGALCLAKGAPAAASVYSQGLGGPASSSVGDITITGQPGGWGLTITNVAIVAAPAGGGGSSFYGAGGPNTPWTNSTIAGVAAPGRGGGGAGGSIGVGGTVIGGAGGNGICIITEYAAVSTSSVNAAAPVPGSLSGLTLTWNSATSLTVGVGGACSDDATTQMNLTTAITRPVNTLWSVGGLLDTGAIAASTWYHVFLISTTTGTVSALISTSVATPVLPGGYSKQRRIGSIKTDASGNMLGFAQLGDEFWWTSSTGFDLSNVGLVTGNTLGAVNVPSGVRVVAIVNVALYSANTAITLVVRSADSGSGAWNANSLFNTTGTVSGQMRATTNTASQISFFTSAAVGNGVYCGAVGWIDNRGK